MKAALLALMLMATPACACDLALVLVQDTSSSLDNAEMIQMREGVANALTDPRLASSFAAANVQIAVIAYGGRPELAVDWFTANPETLAQAADRIRTMPRVADGTTATGRAIEFALAQLDRTECASRVIDVATDGENNSGPPPSAVLAGVDPFSVQINGLVVGNEMAVAQFEATTQFGASAFTVRAETYDDFGLAMMRKLSLEVSQNVGGARAS